MSDQMPNQRNQNKPALAGKVSNIITVIIVAMLIISGPSQAVQIKINMENLNDRQVGETGFFYINVTIGSNERIPIANISVENLPDIAGSPDGVLAFNVSDFGMVGDTKIEGNYNISLVYRDGWTGGYGYGYGYNNNYETAPFYGYGYGYKFYGYGYGYSNGNSDTYTELKYKVTVNTTGAIPGMYNAVVKINTGQGAVFQKSSSFTLVFNTVANPKLTGNISGYNINDANGNGEWDAGERGMSNWMIKLIGITDTKNDTRIIKRAIFTNSTGFYMFDDLPAGEYIIMEKLKRGFVPTNTTVKIIALSRGEDSMNNNFTNRPVRRLSIGGGDKEDDPEDMD